MDAAGRTGNVREKPAPRVLQRNLSDFYVEYELVFHLERAGLRPQTLSDLHREIQDGFNGAGVQIMSPHFRVQPDVAVLAPRERWGDGAAQPAPEA